MKSIAAYYVLVAMNTESRMRIGAARSRSPPPRRPARFDALPGVGAPSAPARARTHPPPARA